MLILPSKTCHFGEMGWTSAIRQVDGGKTFTLQGSGSALWTYLEIYSSL
jgi:hypothetical protein